VVVVPWGRPVQLPQVNLSHTYITG
jgi:hypothetical protein